VKANAFNAAQPSRQPGGQPPGDEVVPQARQAVTVLYQAHALGLIRLAVVMLGDRPAAGDDARRQCQATMPGENREHERHDDRAAAPG
jgi:hypothetical protein